MIQHHTIYRVISFKIKAPYTLEVKFDDNSVKIINFAPILKGCLYGPLNDISLFNRVKIDPEVRTLVWPNGADFDPSSLHDWEAEVEELIALANNWENS